MAKLSVNDVISHVMNDEMEECDSDEDFDGYIDDEETERILQHRTGYGNNNDEMNEYDDNGMNGGNYEEMDGDNNRMNSGNDGFGSDTLGDDAMNVDVEETRYGDYVMDGWNGRIDRADTSAEMI